MVEYFIGMGDVFLSEFKERQQIPKAAVFGGLILLIVVIFSYGVFFHGNRSGADDGDGQKVYVRIAPGMNAERIASLLKEEGVIDHDLMFRLAAKWSGSDGKFKTGDYQLKKHMENKEVLAMLVAGQTATLRVTIPEGYGVEQIAKTLAEKGIVKEKDFCRAAEGFKSYDYMTTNKETKYRAEGFLFPDTYEIAGDFTAEDIMKMMVEQFDHELTPEMRTRAEEMGLTIRQLVILASLVEKEAQVEEDRPIIAQVFLNRIQKEMPLQSCATIQYILGNPKAELSVEDTKIESPYNTYLHRGLPPGPIANPGIASIKAVLYAEPVPYLYFVADKNGKHHFSVTYEEHLRAIDKVS